MYEHIYHCGSALSSRLELVRPKPLSQEESACLFLDPFRDLGFTVPEPNRLMEVLLDLTGGLPQHLQYLGMRLAESLTPEADDISLDDIVVAGKDLEYAHYLRAAFRNVDASLQPVALRLLRMARTPFDATTIKSAFREANLAEPSLIAAADVGDTLVIANFLSWVGRGSYRVACPVMADCVQVG